VRRFVSVGGGALECERIAPLRTDSPVLVFLHDGLGCLATWRDLPARLAERTGCGALVYSRIGYGASSARPGPWPARFMHEEALVTLPELLASEAIDDAVFIGHSDGASIALIAAGAAPWRSPLRLRALLLEAPHTFVEPVCLDSISRLVATYRSSGLAASLARYHGAQADACFAHWSAAWLAPSFREWNLAPYLPAIPQPVFVMQGLDDDFGTPAQVAALGRGVAGPCASLLVSGAGHTPHRDRRELVLALWEAFLRPLLAGSS
jgi:pimeloyl-ACP methyl ester carboxylesterase